MFDQQNQNPQTNVPAMENISDSDVHVMPTDYVQTPLPEGKSKKLWLILGISGAVVLAILVVLVIAYLRQQAKNDQAQVIPPAVQTPTTTAPVAPTTTPTTTPVTADTALERDEIRVNDILSLNSAVQFYFNDKGAYPESLAALVSQYLDKVPRDPKEDGTLIYDYRPSNDKLDYQIIFTIEDSAKYNNVKLKAGQYTANGRGVFPYQTNPNSGGNNNLPTGLNNQPPTAGQDSDQDTLSDIEENVFRTSPDNADSDGDSYKDAEELLSFYDPTKAKQKLANSGLVNFERNETFNYSVIYPAAWVVRAPTADDREVYFSSANGEFFTISVLDNPNRQTSSQWFSSIYPSVDNLQIKAILLAGLPAVQSPDGLNTYLAVGDKVFALSYNLGISSQANFLTTYKLFLKSFTFLAPLNNNGNTGTSTPQ